MNAAFTSLSHSIRSAFRLSVAARVAVSVVLGLTAILLVVWASYAWNPRYIPWSAYMSWSRGAQLVMLMAALAGVSYLTVRVWLADRPTEWSIHRSWSRGLDGLRERGLAIDALPINLVLGQGCGSDETSLYGDVSDYRLVIPSGDNDGLSFFANAKRLCLGVAGLGLTAVARTASAEALRNWSPDRRTNVVPRVMQALSAITDAGETQSQPADHRARSTVSPRQLARHASSPSWTADESQPERQPRGPAVALDDADPLTQALRAVGLEPGEGDRRGEFAPASDRDDDEDAGAQIWSNGNSRGVGVLDPPLPVTRRSIAQPLALLQSPLATAVAPMWSRAEAVLASEKLHQLASLLRRARRPLCPVNRLIVTIPVALLLDDTDRVPEWQVAIRQDLTLLRRVFQINAPVTVVVTGWEQHPGFVEFMRRVGPLPLQQQTIGHAIAVGSPTTTAQMEALAINACGHLEDCLYALLQQTSALNSPGNLKLYRLLCDLRTGLRQSLTELLQGVFATDSGEAPGQYVAGCYFCATGELPHLRGFVDAVWQVQDHGQEELDWLPEALQQEALHLGLCRLGWWAIAGLTAAAVALLTVAPGP